ncbi:uncharacterized protein AAGF69_005441 [Amazona ochrocephala]
MVSPHQEVSLTVPVLPLQLEGHRGCRTHTQVDLVGRHHHMSHITLVLVPAQAPLVAIPMALLRLIPTNRGIIPMGTLLQDPLTALRSTIKKDEKKLSKHHRCKHSSSSSSSPDSDRRGHLLLTSH